MVEEKNVDIALRVFELFNQHDWAAMAALYADPAEFKDPSLGIETVMQTRDQIVEKYSEMAQVSPDVRDDVVAVYPSGSKHVIVEFVSSGSMPDGNKWMVPICTIMTIENGVITRDYTYYDRS